MAAVVPSDVRTLKGDGINIRLLTVTLTSASDTITLGDAPVIKGFSYIKTTGAATAITYVYNQTTGVITIAAGANNDVLQISLITL